MFNFFYCPYMHLKPAQVDFLRGRNLSLLDISREGGDADSKFFGRLPS